MGWGKWSRLLDWGEELCSGQVKRDRVHIERYALCEGVNHSLTNVLSHSGMLDSLLPHGL